MKIHSILQDLYNTKSIDDLSGKSHEFRDSVTKEEALMLMKMVKVTNAKTTLETGLAYGASAISMCSEAHKNHKDNMHYAIDPNQLEEYGGAAIALLKKANLENNFTHLNGCSHEVFPLLLKKNEPLDCAFIDGWHTFDYTMIDFFLIDKLLKPEGLIAFHDMYGLAKQKVLRYILTHRDYEVAKEYRVQGSSFLNTVKFFLWRIKKQPRLLFSWYHWTYQTKSNSGLIVLRKKSSFEPPFSFYKNF